MLHLGDQNVYGGVRRFAGEKLYQTMVRDATEVFRRGDIPELIRAVDRNFGTGTFSLRYLFRDEQRKIVASILENATAEASALYRSFYGQYGTLIRFVTRSGDSRCPPKFQMAVDFSLNEDLLDRPLPGRARSAERSTKSCDQVKRAGILLDWSRWNSASAKAWSGSRSGSATVPPIWNGSRPSRE